MTDITITTKQAHRIAAIIRNDISSYVQAHQEEFKKFLEQQKQLQKQ